MDARRPRADHPADRWLIAWGAYVRKGNRVNLGYAQFDYAEHVRASQSASDWTPPQVDPEVLVIDRIVRLHLAPFPRQIVTERYANLLSDSQAARLVRISRSEYSKMINKVVLPQVRHLWDLSVAQGGLTAHQ